MIKIHLALLLQNRKVVTKYKVKREVDLVSSPSPSRSQNHRLAPDRAPIELEPGSVSVDMWAFC